MTQMVQNMSRSIRHPDFEKIHSAFLTHYSKDPKLGESRYADWVKFSGLDETQSYYLQGAARANKSKQSFEWANFLLQFVKEDNDVKYYQVEALFLKYAWEHPDSYIAIVGPSWRQTKLNIRRMGGFCRELPVQQGLHVQKTRITLPNGSMIEAFPNNPDTIRGPTFKVIWIEECNFVPNDEELYDAILFTLGTTNGKLIATSTPWNTDSLFWKMFNHKDYSDFARSHVAWSDALEPNGPLKPAIVED
jgi:phage terminase large subunit-like protein